MARILTIELEPALESRLRTAGHAAESGFAAAECDLAILAGLDALRSLRRNFPALPVLMLSPRDTVADRVTGLDAGADDYLASPCSAEELLARVRALLRRAAIAPARLAASGVDLDLIRRRATRAGQGVELAPKEFDLLEYLMRNRGRPVTRPMIVERVWNERYDGLTNIVDVYVRHLRAKIDDMHTVKLIRTVRGVGYLFEDA